MPDRPGDRHKQLHICRHYDQGFHPYHGNPGYYCSRPCRAAHKSRQVHPALDEAYFRAIDTPQKAYWLGFLYADGSVIQQPTGSWRFTLNLAQKDEDQLDRFINAVGANPQQKKFPRAGVVFIAIGNQAFVQYLRAAGCTERKTYSITLPNFANRPCDLAFLLGYFDGDGCAGTGPSPVPLLTSGAVPFLQQVRHHFQIPYPVQQPLGSAARLTLPIWLYQEMLAAYPASMPRKRLGIPRRSATSRYRGVSWKAARQKWQAAIHDQGRSIYLGIFSTEEEAYQAYLAAVDRKSDRLTLSRPFLARDVI